MTPSRQTSWRIGLALSLSIAFVLSASSADARPRRARTRTPSGCAAVAGCAALGAPAQGAFQQLMNASVFATPTTQADEVVPPDLVAIRTLVADPRALDALEHLFRNASPAGRLYAVVGFWAVAPTLYHARREALLHTRGQEQVTCQLGPNTQPRTIHEVLSNHTGVARYRPGTDQLAAFCPPLLQRSPNAMGSDVAGGGATIAILYGARVTREECDGWAASRPNP